MKNTKKKFRTSEQFQRFIDDINTHITAVHVAQNVEELHQQCGLLYISSLCPTDKNNGFSVAATLQEILENNSVSGLLFSDTTTSENASLLKKYAYTMPSLYNSNSGNRIKVWLLTKAHVLQMANDYYHQYEASKKPKENEKTKNCIIHR